MSHIKEGGREPPPKPIIFARFANSQVGHRETLIRPKASETYDYEGELAVIIGQRCRHVAKEDAGNVIVGYACYNEGSVREWQRHSAQFIPGKNFFHSGAFGPWIVTPDETGDISRATLLTRLNGEEVQRATIDDLCFDIPALINYISTFTQLEPGDVIVTGTTGGVGAYRTPPLWMRHGDTVEVEVSAGDRIFCAGADLKERNGMSRADWQHQHEIFERGRDALLQVPVPVIAAVHGPAYAGGLETVLVCDFAYAVRTARFALTGVTRGIMPGGGGTQTLPRVVGERRAKEIILTGRPFSAEEAFEWGVINRICEPADMMNAVLEQPRPSATTPRFRSGRPRNLSITACDGPQARPCLRNRGLLSPDRHRRPTGRRRRLQ